MSTAAPGRLPAAIAQALAPWAPAHSSVHADAIEALNRERFVLALVTEECKTCKNDDLMFWWAWRDQQFGKAARLERASIRSDLAYNDLKNSGELRRREDARALAEQVQWGVQ